MSNAADNSPRTDPRLPTVLVVEDEPLIRMGLAAALRGERLNAVEACNAAEALEVIHAGVTPDALFTDILMPGAMDGLQLAALLESTFPDMKVFVCSGLMERRDLKLRVNFIPKPIAAELVARQIKGALTGA